MADITDALIGRHGIDPRPAWPTPQSTPRFRKFLRRLDASEQAREFALEDPVAAWRMFHP